MHTTKDKLSALVIMWLIITFFAFLLACIYMWALPIAGGTASITMYYQDKWDEWKYLHTDDVDIKMMADMDRPE